MRTMTRVLLTINMESRNTRLYLSNHHGFFQIRFELYGYPLPLCIAWCLNGLDRTHWIKLDQIAADNHPAVLNAFKERFQ